MSTILDYMSSIWGRVGEEKSIAYKSWTFFIKVCLFWWYGQTNAETILSKWVIDLILFGSCVITVKKWTHKYRMREDRKECCENGLD